MDCWKEKLSEEDYEQLEVILDLQSQIDSIHGQASFIYGFKLGAIIMIEVLTGKMELVSEKD